MRRRTRHTQAAEERGGGAKGCDSGEICARPVSGGGGGRCDARKQRKAAQGPSSSAAECAVAHAILCTQPTELVDPLHKSPPSSSNGQGLSNRFSKTVYCELWITISSIRGTVPLAARTQPPQECPVFMCTAYVVAAYPLHVKVAPSKCR